MRTRLALGGIAAALALGTVAPAQAAPAPQVRCAEGFEVICLVVCLVSKPCTI